MYIFDPPGKPAQLLKPGPKEFKQAMVPYEQGQLGATEDIVKTLKDLLVMAALFLAAYWLFFSKRSPLKNSGGGGRNKIVKVIEGANEAWYYKLLRKGARRHGPFVSADAAAGDAEWKGYKVLE